jgi:capsular polysaccharide biosynthesis protein
MSNFFPIQKLKNVFVTNNLVITHQGKVVKDSCVGEEFYKKYAKFGFKIKYFLPFFSLRKKPYILIADEWSKNYCHWLWEALSKLIVLRQEFPAATLLLPKSYRKINFMMKSLEAFGIKDKNIKFIPKKSKLWVRNLAYIQCIGSGNYDYYNFLKFDEVSQTLIAHHKKNFKINFGDKIYISRSNPKTNTARQVVNEAELVAILEKHGFKTVYMENFSFLEQMSIANAAKFVIAPHGAGITNFMFSENAYLIELVNTEYEKTCFAHMCDKMKSRYYRIDCADVDQHKVFELRNIVVDVTKVENHLTKILH